MRYLLKYKLPDSSTLNVVLFAISKKDAQEEAIRASSKLPKKYALKVSYDSTIEKWDEKTKTPLTDGIKKFGYFIVGSDGDIRTGQIEGRGVKSAIKTLSVYTDYLTPNSTIYIVDLAEKERLKRLSKKSSIETALKVVKDKTKLVAKFTDAFSRCKAMKNVPYLREIAVMLDMVVDYMEGNYKEVPFNTIVGITAAVLYFLSPVDLIPDFLPGIGQVDDITVLGFAVKATYEDLMKYDNWRKKKK